jgi:hypothetical protein
MDFASTAKSLVDRVTEYFSKLELFSQGYPLWPKLSLFCMGFVFYRLYKRFTRKSITGEVVLVTGMLWVRLKLLIHLRGGASGIGRLVAKRLSKLGSTVVIWDVNQKGMDEVANEIKSEKREVCAIISA